jgi:sterol desaturase/sphingolipid hydroxylase (fatty acid hydroxylase superfamily)
MADTQVSFSLTDAARVFGRQRTPRIIATTIAVALGLRLLVGRWSWRDAVIPVVILGLEPFTEWAVHVFLLHARPRTVFGRTVDLMIARKHRAHHADPRDVELVFIPTVALVVGLTVGAVAFLTGFRDAAPALTGIVASFSMLLTYEWTHYLIHSPYRPMSRYYRSIWRAHRLHHYRNERYWFGVTVNLADHVLRTFPEKDAVPASPTARTLGVATGVGPAR